VVVVVIRIRRISTHTWHRKRDRYALDMGVVIRIRRISTHTWQHGERHRYVLDMDIAHAYCCTC